jgi:hypothetical protein
MLRLLEWLLDRLELGEVEEPSTVNDIPNGDPK